MNEKPEVWTYNGEFITADGENPIMREDVPHPERVRISHLIAAAPELLVSLEAMLFHSECYCSPIEWEDGICCHMKAKAIIDKAKGLA